MKKLLFLLLFCVSASLFGQENSAIQNLLKDQSFSKISNYFSSTLELKLPNSKGVYNHSQADLILQEFSKLNPELVYSSKHNGGSVGKAQFEIGRLNSAKATFRTYLLYNLKEGTPEIIELRIEPEQ